MDEITIPRRLAEELLEHVNDMLCHYHLDNQRADYCCEFCGKAAHTNVDLTVDHCPDCDGIRLQTELETFLYVDGDRAEDWSEITGLRKIG